MSNAYMQLCPVQFYQHVESCEILLCIQVMGHGGCLTARTALVYKLRASEDAVLDLHAAISKHHKTGIDPR